MSSLFLSLNSKQLFSYHIFLITISFVLVCFSFAWLSLREFFDFNSFASNKIIFCQKKNKMSFLGKVVLLTGSSSGIGKATALRLSKEGATLALTGRNLESLKAVAKDVGEDKAIIVTGDVTQEADNENILKKTIEKFGKLDVLINNAGILETGSIENTSLEQFDRIMNHNIRSIYQLTMLSVPWLIKSQGNIVNVSSVNGLRSFPGVLAYNISKCAVDQFTRCVALELAAKKVRKTSFSINSISFS